MESELTGLGGEIERRDEADIVVLLLCVDRPSWICDEMDEDLERAMGGTRGTLLLWRTEPRALAIAGFAKGPGPRGVGPPEIVGWMDANRAGLGEDFSKLMSPPDIRRTWYGAITWG